MNEIALAFFAGLTTGGVSCFAVQGGLLTASIASDKKENQKNKIHEISYFLGSKILAYTVLGGLLGLLGASVFISVKLQAFIQLAIGIFMIATAGRLLNLHPVFRYFVVTPPKFVMRFIRQKSKSESIFKSAFLGFLTVLIPCGVTQAMMLYAIGTSSALTGALVMFAFVLGTTPVFFAMALATAKFTDNKYFNYLAGAFIAIIGILSINTFQVLSGSQHTLQNYWAVIKGESSSETSVLATKKEGAQEVEITVSSFGYESKTTTLKAGVPVKLKLTSIGVRSCARAFVIPSINYFKILPETGTEIVEFTPAEKGRLTYACSMGMYTGYFEVI